MAEVLHAGPGKLALGEADEEAVVSQEAENLAEMVEVGTAVRTGDQDVIQVDKTERETVEDPVHEPLEGLGGVPQTEGHPEELEQTKGGDDGGLGDVIGGHGDLVVPLKEVNLGEDGAAMEVIGKILDVGEGVTVMEGGVVQTAIIAAGAPRTVGLGDHVEG